MSFSSVRRKNQHTQGLSSDTSDISIIRPIQHRLVVSDGHIMYRRHNDQHSVEEMHSDDRRRDELCCNCTLVKSLTFVTVISVLMGTLFVGMFAWAYGMGNICFTDSGIKANQPDDSPTSIVPVYTAEMAPFNLTMDVLYAVSESMRQLSVAQSEQCGGDPAPECGLILEEIGKVAYEKIEVGQNFVLDLDLKSDSTCCQKDQPMQCREMTAFIPSPDNRDCDDKDNNPKCQKFAGVANGLSKCRFVTHDIKLPGPDETKGESPGQVQFQGGQTFISMK